MPPAKWTPQLAVTSQVVLLLVLCTKFCNSHNNPPLAYHYFGITRHVDCRGGVKLTAKQSKNSAQKVNTNARSGGGFGAAKSGSASKKSRAATQGEPNVADYAIFPPLEPHVQATLIPSSTAESSSGPLSLEMYSRLDQIYGFSNFNYASVKASDTQSDNYLVDILATKNDPTDEDAQQERQLLASSLNKIPAFPEFRVMHVDPLVLTIDNFFTMQECDRCISLSSGTSLETRSKTVGKDSVSKAQRTSTTWFHPYSKIPELIAKATRLMGINTIRHWEEPQTVRYRKSEHFSWHLDALAPSANLKSLGGQRIATLLVYLTDLSKDEDGGATVFRDLNLKIRPKKGTALLFFPAAGGIRPSVPLDIRTVHAGEAVSESAEFDKWIAQLWLREGNYTPTAPIGNIHDLASLHQFCSEQSNIST